MFNDIMVLGAGSFGTAMAQHMAQNSPDSRVFIYDKDEDLISHMMRTKGHKYFFKSIRLADNIIPVKEIRDGDLTVISVPVKSIRDILKGVSASHILNCSKGIESSKGRFVSEIVSEKFPESKYAMISGGMIASDFIRKKGIFHADIVSSDIGFRNGLRSLLDSRYLKTEGKSDVVFYEALSALKNVVAISVGIMEGMGFPNSTKSILISKGAYECREIAREISHSKRRDMGVPFWSDYITSTTGNTRNRYLGKKLGEGRSVAESLDILKNEKKTAEGYHTIAALRKRKTLERYPILDATFKILYKGKDPSVILESISQ